MKPIVYILFFPLLLLSFVSKSQILIGRQVIGSSGANVATSNLKISSTVGETIIKTKSSTNLILTQGFQQTFNKGDSLVTFEVKNESCVGAMDGLISVLTFQECSPPYELNIQSLNSNNSNLNQSSLATGDYQAEIKSSDGCIYVFDFFIGLDSDENCQLKFYSGITPNGDGQNDTWQIDNIDLFPENEVGIYNRVGEEIWFTTGYDNISNVWDGTGNNGNLVNATYFYVVKIGNNTYKGWVELTN